MNNNSVRMNTLMFPHLNGSELLKAEEGIENIKIDKQLT